MSLFDRHRQKQKQDPDPSNDRLRNLSADDQTSQPTCDQPLRIVIAEDAGPEGNSQVFCVHSGWLCELTGNSVEFVCSDRLSRRELFLEIRCQDNSIRFEVAEIAEESQTPHGLWRYLANFVVRDIVDRYEFD
jgi:hypothetical protein